MADTLASAKAALMGAKDFDKTVAKQAGHEYSAAPYSAAHKARTSPVGSAAAEKGLGAELAAKKQNVDEYLKATK